MNGQAAKLGDPLPDRARVWIETDRSKFTITREWPTLVTTNLARHLVNKLLYRIGVIGSLLINELEKLDNFYLQDDPLLCEILLMAALNTRPNSDDRYSQYKEFLEGKAVQDTVRRLKECLDRYKLLRDDLVDAQASKNYPRSIKRLLNLLNGLNCLDLFRDYDIDTNEDLLAKVFRSELDSKEVARRLSIERRRRSREWHLKRQRGN